MRIFSKRFYDERAGVVIQPPPASFSASAPITLLNLLRESPAAGAASISIQDTGSA